jgi:predicted permease
MSLFFTMAQLQLEMFLLMFLGYLCKKRGLITEAAERSLSDLLLYVILPANILHSFTSGIEVSESLMRNCLLAVLFSFVIQMTAIYSSKALFRRWPREKENVARYGLIVSNSSFIGIPVVERAYENLGVLYTAFFQIPIRFTMWSAGLALFTAVDKKQAIKKILLHPCVIACEIGTVFMLLQWTLPGFWGDTVTALSRCTTPVSMLVVGSILADADWRQVLQKDVLLFCLLRLAAFPLIVWLCLRALHADAVLTGVTVMLTAMPAGSTTAILPKKYGCDAEYGASLIFTSTILSLLTIPVFALLLAQ